MNKERNELLGDLYQKYYDVIYRQCLFLVDYNPQYYPLIEDCIQDAFVMAVIKYDEYKDYRNPMGWIARVAYNRVRSKIRDERNHSQITPLLIDERYEEIVFATDALENELKRKEQIETILQVYAALTEQEKTVFVHYFLEDLSLQETVDATHLSKNSVRSAVKRIRKRSRIMKTTNFLILIGAFFGFHAPIK